MLTYQPSLLVGLSISRRGGVHYIREELEVVARELWEQKRWETTRQIENKAELDKAEKAVGEFRRMLNRVCIRTGFGLLCLKSREEVLDEVVAEIRARTANMNDELETCRIHVGFVKGQIASGDKEAAAAITTEIRTFMEELNSALRAMDPKRIRAALLSGQGLDTVLSATDSKILAGAVATAKQVLKAARKRVQKKGEQVELVRASISLDAVDQARTHFLEIETEG